MRAWESLRRRAERAGRVAGRVEGTHVRQSLPHLRNLINQLARGLNNSGRAGRAAWIAPSGRSDAAPSTGAAIFSSCRLRPAPPPVRQAQLRQLPPHSRLPQPLTASSQHEQWLCQAPRASPRSLLRERQLTAR